MKHLFAIFFVISLISCESSQEVKKIESMGTINVTNGKGETIEISYLTLGKENLSTIESDIVGTAPKPISYDYFRNVVNIAIREAKYECKHKLTFEPKDILVSFTNTDKCRAVVTYYASNSFGVPGELPTSINLIRKEVKSVYTTEL